MAAQQSAREERGKVHKDLPQQGSCLFKGMLQTLRDTKKKKTDSGRSNLTVIGQKAKQTL